MYEKVIVDGKVVEVKIDLDKDETGVVIEEQLEKTMDLKEVVEEIKNEQS